MKKVRLSVEDSWPALRVAVCVSQMSLMVRQKEQPCFLGDNFRVFLLSAVFGSNLLPFF